MKKILTVSLFAIMAVGAANAEIASTTYVKGYTGDKVFTGSVAGQADLTAAVNVLAGKVDTVVGEGTGSVADQISGALKEATADDFSDSVKASLGEADSAVQKGDVTTGETNGTIKVQDKEVAVAGLGSAAYTDSTAYDAAGAATNAVAALDSSVAAESGKIITGLTVVDGKITASEKMTLDSAISEQNKASTNAPTTAAVTGYVQSQIDAFSNDSFAGVAIGLEEAQADIKSIKESAYANSGVTADIVAEAQSAVQKGEVTTGETNGTIKVQDKEVAVAGLGSAAYTDSTAYDAAGAATNAVAALDSSVAVEANKVVTGLTVVDGKITVAEKMALTALASFPVECNDSDTHCALTINGGVLAWEVVK